MGNTPSTSTSDSKPLIPTTGSGSATHYKRLTEETKLAEKASSLEKYDFDAFALRSHSESKGKDRDVPNTLSPASAPADSRRGDPEVSRRLSLEEKCDRHEGAPSGSSEPGPQLELGWSKGVKRAIWRTDVFYADRDAQKKLEAVIRRELRNRTARSYNISLMCDINDRVRVEFTPIAHAKPFSKRSQTVLQEVVACAAAEMSGTPATRPEGVKVWGEAPYCKLDIFLEADLATPEGRLLVAGLLDQLEERYGISRRDHSKVQQTPGVFD